MIIYADKFYTARNGKKVKVYETGCHLFCGAHGAYQENDGIWYSGTWHSDGAYIGRDEHELDLIAPWFDPPMVDWDKFPPHIIALAMNEIGTWRGYLDRPSGVNEKQGVWYLTEEPYFRAMFEIKLDDYPIFSGDWRDSLAIRPGFELDTQPHIQPIQRNPTLSSTHSEHTPGPWRIGEAGGVVSDAPTGFDDDDNMRAYGGHLVCESVWTLGNRRLIAAAPELLEACEKAKTFLQRVVCGGDEWRSVYDTLDSCINKALGKEEKE